jgi:Domain of unknown function (DUF4365)
VPLTEPHAKETLCAAHIHATAGMARVNLSCRLMFDYGVDGVFENILDIHEGRLIPSPFTVAYQAKASVDWIEEDDCIVYDLESGAYNDIATRPEKASTLILILLCLPKDTQKWHAIDADEQHTLLKHYCYWHVFKGEPTPNKYKQRIRIPKDQIFTPDALKFLLAVEHDRLTT